MCDCGACDDWNDWPSEDGRSETITSWADFHHALNGAWHMIEADLRRSCSPWLLQDIRRDWYRKQLAELSPETCRALDRASDGLN